MQVLGDTKMAEDTFYWKANLSSVAWYRHINKHSAIRQML